MPYNSVKIAGDFEADLAQALKNREAEINATRVNAGEDEGDKLVEKIQQSVVQRYASMPWGQQFLNDPSVDIKTRFPNTYAALSDPEDPQNETITGIQAAVNEELGQPQTFTDTEGNKETYKFTFDEEGKPIAGSLNGQPIPSDVLEEALEVAKEKGLYKNHVTLIDSASEIEPPTTKSEVTSDTEVTTLTDIPKAVEKKTYRKERFHSKGSMG